MSITYTADVFCDGLGCINWTHGVSNGKPPGKKEARDFARQDGGYKQINGRDYCPVCQDKMARGEPVLNTEL